jgi:hypothetical protein
MVTTCVAFGCKYKHIKGNKVGLYRFPQNAARRKMWTNAIKRLNWEPSASSRICGKHFQTGKKLFFLDQTHKSKLILKL